MTKNQNFDDVGFISEQSRTDDFNHAIHQSQQFQLCEQLNQLGQRISNQNQIHPDDEGEVYLVLYFQRLMAHFQAVLLLSERGMTHQTEIMTRCILEVFINMAAYYRHPEFLDAMTAHDDNKKLAVLQQFYLEQKRTPTLTEEELQHIKLIIASPDQIDREDIAIYVKAEYAGLMYEYRTTYALLTESVKSCIHSLQTDLIFDEQTNSIVGMATRQDETDRLISLLMTSATYLADAISIMLNLYSFPEQTEEFQRLKSSMQKVWSQTSVKVSHR